MGKKSHKRKKDHTKWEKERQAAAAAESQMDVETPLGELELLETALGPGEESSEDGPCAMDERERDVRLKVKVWESFDSKFFFSSLVVSRVGFCRGR